MLHPAAAHFAISLPIISLVLGLLYLFRPTDVMSKVSTRFLVFAAIFVVVAYFTGKNDAGLVINTLGGLDYVNPPALLGEHAKLGQYLAIAMVVVALIKMFGCFKKMYKIELFAIILLAVLSAGILSQGKMGGELTYEQGLNVAKHAQMQNVAAEAAEMGDDEDEDE